VNRTLVIIISEGFLAGHLGMKLTCDPCKVSVSCIFVENRYDNSCTKQTLPHIPANINDQRVLRAFYLMD
jgi:hypothetical protein